MIHVVNMFVAAAAVLSIVRMRELQGGGGGEVQPGSTRRRLQRPMIRDATAHPQQTARSPENKKLKV